MIQKFTSIIPHQTTFHNNVGMSFLNALDQLETWSKIQKEVTKHVWFCNLCDLCKYFRSVAFSTKLIVANKINSHAKGSRSIKLM